MNTVGYFEIQSSFPSREIAFYQKVFDWHFIKEEHVPLEYYRIKTNGINGGLLKRPLEVTAQSYGSNAYVCSIQVANFDITAECILCNGGQVVLPKFAIPNRCWQGYFVDEDQNTFGIFEVDEHAK